MGANLEYRFHDLTGRIDNFGPALRTTGNVARKKGEASDFLGAVKRQAEFWGGLALLVSLGIIGIPFLIYFIIGAVAVFLG